MKHGKFQQQHENRVRVCKHIQQNVLQSNLSIPVPVSGNWVKELYGRAI